jgi:hypothetical protein
VRVGARAAVWGEGKVRGPEQMTNKWYGQTYGVRWPRGEERQPVAVSRKKCAGREGRRDNRSPFREKSLKICFGHWGRSAALGACPSGGSMRRGGVNA